MPGTYHLKIERVGEEGKERGGERERERERELSRRR